jgi:RimJ/RimL family protein N-acetyltransferase
MELEDPPMKNDSLPLQVEEVTLRRAGPGDQADLLDYFGHPDVAQFQFWEPWTRDQVDDFISRQSQVRLGNPGVPLTLAVVLESEGRVIGSWQLTINGVEDRQGEVGLAFNPAYCGRGFATRAVKAALGFGFARLHLHRIVVAVDVRNEKSWRLMERVGMRREAHFRHDALSKGEWIDDYIYAILETEWGATGE